MTLEERMTALEARMAQLESRMNQQEVSHRPYGPLPTIPPTNPWPNFPNPYTVTCKLADGTTKEIKLDGPIYATNTK